GHTSEQKNLLPQRDEEEDILRSEKRFDAGCDTAKEPRHGSGFEGISRPDLRDSPSTCKFISCCRSASGSSLGEL
ncbi:hypothetical protein, partial [Bifidobacterium myosotis]|uniref:hypothetical protein n=1 Tax=Bifidobacterium myosotis TaxID=1630166 RepID=UPI001B80D206